MIFTEESLQQNRINKQKGFIIAMLYGVVFKGEAFGVQPFHHTNGKFVFRVIKVKQKPRSG